MFLFLLRKRLPQPLYYWSCKSFQYCFSVNTNRKWKITACSIMNVTRELCVRTFSVYIYRLKYELFVYYVCVLNVSQLKQNLTICTGILYKLQKNICVCIWVINDKQTERIFKCSTHQKNINFVELGMQIESNKLNVSAMEKRKGNGK